MRRYFAFAAALAMAVSLLAGCRGNVSDRNDGMITDPIDTAATAATMPGTDTTPGLNTEPSSPAGDTGAADATIGTTEGTGNPGTTDGNGNTGMTDGNGNAGTTDGNGNTGTTDATGESGAAEGRARHAHPGRRDIRK